MIADHALHAVARALVSVCTPERACQILSRIGARFPQLLGRQEIMRAGARLRGRGTCLTRSLAVAARAPEVEVVIGVAPPSRDRLRAHAWLELCGETIDPPEFAWKEIVRLRSTRRGSTLTAGPGRAGVRGGDIRSDSR